MGSHKKKTKASIPKAPKKVPSKPLLPPTDTPAAPAVQKDIDEHPFDLGHYLVVRYRDDSQRSAKILERSCSNGEWKYYIHYVDFNRRMDEWINLDRILKLPSEANILNAVRVSHHAKAEDSDAVSLMTSNNDDNDSEPSDKRLRSDTPHSEAPSPFQLLQQGPTTIAELEHDEHEGMDELALREHEEITKIKNIKTVLFGEFQIECWYFSPYPKEYYPDGPVDCLYICEFSFRFFRTKSELQRYQAKPSLPRHPPGNEIYRDSNVSMFEIDGAVERIYCQNLCYFAKLFLDHKTLYYDVDPFLFYVLCTQDDRGFHPVGYFSKEKYSDLGYNLACILTFPSNQRQGFGRFLIAFSYELSKKEEKVGSPEKPLSDLGAVSYRSFWASTLLCILRTFPQKHLSIMDLSKLTSIITDDIIATLQHLNLLRNINGNYMIWAPPSVIDELMEKYPVKGLQVDPEKLHWTPLYVTDPRKDKWSIQAKRDNLAS